MALFFYGGDNIRKSWSQEDDNYIANNYQNLSDSQIAEQLNRSPDSVAVRRKRLGYKRQKLKTSFNDVINAFKKTNYTLLSTADEYKNSATNNIKYVCQLHSDKGIQTISLGHLLSGRGCYYCGREKTETAHMINLKNNEDIIKLCESKGFNYIGARREKSKIYIQYICKNHPEAGVQEMQKTNMNRNFIKGCPYCFDKKNSKFSKGEKCIMKYLDEHSIKYIPQYTFLNCKDNCLLPFDFYLPDLNKIIEFDGQHHYYPVNFNGISDNEALFCHEQTVLHDQIKNTYCKNNNIDILRIPYYERNDIDNILNNFLTIN